jgi:hypothetical protein
VPRPLACWEGRCGHAQRTAPTESGAVLSSMDLAFSSTVVEAVRVTTVSKHAHTCREHTCHLLAQARGSSCLPPTLRLA